MPKIKQKLSIDKYKTFIFDCDGVLLNSNQIKTNAFYSAVVSYGQSAAKELVRYHIENGGISRYHKFDYFLRYIVGKEPEPGEIESLLARFATEVKNGLMGCEIAAGIEKLRKASAQSRWLVVSGGDQNELRQIFLKRDLNRFFDGGIFGSPDSKYEILSRELSRGNISRPAVYFGDAKYDYEAAKTAALDFIFISQWSEFKEWEAYFGNDVIQLSSIEDVVMNIY